MNVIEQLEELQKTDQQMADAERRLHREIAEIRRRQVEGRDVENGDALIAKMDKTLQDLHTHRETILREVDRLRRPVN
ncbi:hypothetical protein [Paraburkholderia phosphatilytica]|uniref:hypothetical protein n=1 Tax=Paraburkholderia phosphatilytica TaxID=2282883 RepID=UPI000E485C8C|nr:hypothetical protein [Paraburkholderia phosphatilytica]